MISTHGASVDNFSDLRTRRFLIVEDSRLVQKMISSYLTNWKAHVECADTGRKAKKLLKSHRFDVMILDVNLPDTTGLELLAWVRLRLPDLKIHTLLMTAGEANLHPYSSFSYELLKKPFGEKELRAKVTLLLNKPLCESSSGSNLTSTYDPGFIERVTNGDFKLTIELIRLYISHAADVITRLETSIKRQDEKEFRNLVHLLMSAVSTIGHKDLEKLLGSILREEKTCMKKMATLIETIKAHYQDSKRILLNYLKS